MILSLYLLKYVEGKLLLLDPKPEWSFQNQIIIDRTGECCSILRWVLESGEMPIWPGDSWFSTKHM